MNGLEAEGHTGEEEGGLVEFFWLFGVGLGGVCILHYTPIFSLVGALVNRKDMERQPPGYQALPALHFWMIVVRGPQQKRAPEPRGARHSWAM